MHGDRGLRPGPKILILIDDLVRRVNGIITRYSMLQPGDRVGVAVSGGADSVVLLHVLQALSKDWNFGLYVLHVNHKLRGAESDQDETFVRDLAGALNLPFVGGQGRVPQSNLEQNARRVRQAFFSEVRAEHQLQKIALGHSRSDQAETVLFRMLRGAGLAGLAGIPLAGRNALIRPLLTSGRSEIREFAAAHGILFREDSSNNNPRFTRNRIRIKTLPALSRDYNPNLEEVLAGTAQVAGDEERYWSVVVENVYREASKRTKYGLILDWNKLKLEHLAVRRRVIRRAIMEVRGNLLSIDLRHIESVLQIIDSKYGHDRVTLPGLDVIRSFDLLLIAKLGTLNEPRDYCLEVNLGSCCHLPFEAGILCVTTVTDRAQNCVTVKSGL